MHFVSYLCEDGDCSAVQGDFSICPLQVPSPLLGWEGDPQLLCSKVASKATADFHNVCQKLCNTAQNNGLSVPRKIFSWFTRHGRQVQSRIIGVQIAGFPGVCHLL